VKANVAKTTRTLDGQTGTRAAGEGGRRGWEERTLRPALEKSPERDVRFTTVSDFPIQRLGTPEDIAALNLDSDLAAPGEFPYTRGIHPTMYRGRLWTMRQFSGFGTAKLTNERYRYLLSQGQTGLSVAFDLPTLMGRDSTIPWRSERWGARGLRSTRWRTWRRCSRGSPWIASPRR